MSSNNNDNGAGAAVAIVLAILGAAAIFMFALLAFVAFVLTILAIFAWNSPLTLGNWTLHPHEARAFVGRGILGAILVPAFLLFVNIFLNIPIEWGYFSYMLLGGYTLGSIGIEIMAADQEGTSTPPTATYIPPAPQLPAPPRQSPQSSEVELFRFASWDDDVARKIGWHETQDQMATDFVRIGRSDSSPADLFFNRPRSVPSLAFLYD